MIRILFPLSCLLLCLNFALHAARGSDEQSHAIFSYKAFPDTPTIEAQLRQQWKDKDEALWSYVDAHVPSVLDHTGSAAFDQHLKGVQAVLRHWKAPQHLTLAGLFHSIYGTEGFQGFKLSLEERPVIQQLIGKHAEYLAFVFCMIDRSSFDRTIFDWKYLHGESIKGLFHNNSTIQVSSRPELGAFPIVLTEQQWLDFAELTFADWMEQVEGAAQGSREIFEWEGPGQAYAYKRDIFELLAHLVQEYIHQPRGVNPSDGALAAYRAVMATESPATQDLVQPFTPPMSAAAREAWYARRAAATYCSLHIPLVPLDFAPHPRAWFLEHYGTDKFTSDVTNCQLPVVAAEDCDNPDQDSSPQCTK